MYETSVAIHVVAAIAGFGATFAYPVIQLVGERRGARELALETILAVSRWVAVPSTIVVGATGIYQALAGPYGFGDAWLGVAFALYLAVMLVAILYLAPAYRRALSDYDGAMRGVNVVGPFVSAAVVAIAVLMVVKP